MVEDSEGGAAPVTSELALSGTEPGAAGVGLW